MFALCRRLFTNSLGLNSTLSLKWETFRSICFNFTRYSSKRIELPPLNEEELEESFIKGGGPGGQKINKSANCCQLKHIPTGIVVSCQQSRLLEENRKLARRILQQKLDLHLNKENSVVAKLRREKQEEKTEKNKRAVKNLARKNEFKQRENLK
jgi:protein subunit release factor B